MIIDLASRREQRNGPDEDCVTYDFDGTPLYLYQVQYRYEGRAFVFEIFARSRGDADRRVSQIRHTAETVAQVVASV